jgi:hypothetical protein
MTGVASPSAVVVTGQEAMATASAALDLARAEARQRPVTVVDLIGDAAPMRNAVSSPDAHGVADCFAYGVSFGAVTRPTSIDPRVSLIPSGTEPLNHADILPSERWERLISGARDRGALIVFAALSNTPGLDSLIARVDSAIPAALVLSPLVPAVVTRPAPQRSYPAQAGSRPRRSASRRSASSRRGFAIAAAGAVVAVIVVGFWIVRRPPMSEAGAQLEQRTDTLTSTAQLGVADRAGGPSAAGGFMPPVTDPQDSAAASAFALRVGTYRTYAEALRDLRQREVKRGAATITPLEEPGPAPGPPVTNGGRAQSFVVYVGAARTADKLDSTARAWAHAGGFAGGAVTRTPYALRLTDRVSADSARRATITWRGQGIPAYALVDHSGQAAVYAGAFVSLDQTVPLAASLHAAGLVPTAAYRVGVAP